VLESYCAHWLKPALKPWQESFKTPTLLGMLQGHAELFTADWDSFATKLK
jgi:hypothetical protein